MVIVYGLFEVVIVVAALPSKYVNSQGPASEKATVRSKVAPLPGHKEPEPEIVASGTVNSLIIT